MNKCPHCGSELQENAKFCLYCMKPLKEKNDITPPKKSKIRRAIIISATATVAAVLLFCCFIFFFERSKANEPQKSPDAQASDSISTDELLEKGDTADKSDTEVSSPGTLPPCADGHTWDPVTKTVHYDEVGHYESVLTGYIDITVYKCALCYGLFDSYDSYYNHFQNVHIPNEDELIITFLDRYETDTKSEPVYEDQWVVDAPAYDKEITTGYLCTVCGEESSDGTEENPDNEKIITNFDDFVLRATYLTGKAGLSELWDPDSFILTHKKNDSDGDTWEIYSPNVFLDDVRISVSFCLSGEEILTSVTGVTDENMDSAMLLCECLISAVCNYTYENLNSLLTDHRTYPLFLVEDGVSLPLLAELKDPEASLFDEGTLSKLERMSIDISDDGNADMVYDLRTRIYEGKTYYDLFFLHSQY